MPRVKRRAPFGGLPPAESGENGNGVGTVPTERRSRAEPIVERAKIQGVVVGELIDAADGDDPRIDFPGNTTAAPLTAVSTVGVSPGDVGRSVVLAFDGGDPTKPIILGVIGRAALNRPNADAGAANGEADRLQVTVDGERVTISAEKEIVLRCGKASITLTRAGKVIVRGAYLLSRSSGVNRIKGGSVQIN